MKLCSVEYCHITYKTCSLVIRAQDYSMDNIRDVLIEIKDNLDAIKHILKDRAVIVKTINVPLPGIILIGSELGHITKSIIFDDVSISQYIIATSNDIAYVIGRKFRF